MVPTQHIQLDISLSRAVSTRHTINARAANKQNPHQELHAPARAGEQRGRPLHKRDIDTLRKKVKEADTELGK